MSTRIRRPHEENYWSIYLPEKDIPWDLPRVVHLHRRAGFAATWSERLSHQQDGLTVEAGQVKDLGDLKSKPEGEN